MLPGGKLRAQHRPLFHGLALIVRKVKPALLHDLVEGSEAVIPLFGDLPLIYGGTGKVGVKAVAVEVDADVLRRFDARHGSGGRCDRIPGKMYGSGHGAAQADGTQGQRPGLPQSRFGNSKHKHKRSPLTHCHCNVCGGCFVYV